ncbi:ricin-type beta-trefoil lectin domain protein [Streptomyces laurentii]|uniref:ricin-type beta-trefoil lectin domain protein n=1 Tax=Streptomyces laurentii TaxID=39478 RepID=UPI0033C4A3E0
MPSQDSARPNPSSGTSGAGSDGPRFADAFRRRPATPRRRLLPERRVWTTVAGAAVATAVVALAVPALGRVTFVSDEPAAHVAAVPAPSRTGPASAAPAAPAASGTPSQGPASAAPPPTPGAPAHIAPPPVNRTPDAPRTPDSGGTREPGAPAQPRPRETTARPAPKPTKKAAPPPAGSLIVGIGSQRCVDVSGGIPVDGLQLQIHDCDGRAPQRWEFRGDGSLRAMGMCMDVAWGSSDDGASIQLARCSGNPAQRFVMSGEGDLVNPQANKCVEVKGRSTGDGSKLQLWRCTGNSNQKWRLG